MIKYVCGFYDEFGYLLFNSECRSLPKSNQIIQHKDVDYRIKNIIEYEEIESKDFIVKYYFIKFRVELVCYERVIKFE